MHRRLRMPDVSEFLKNDKVLLGVESIDKDDRQLSMLHLHAWLQALLAGPVNEHENSKLRIPIPTVRALSQLVSRLRASIPTLETAYFGEANVDPVTRLMRRVHHVQFGRPDFPSQGTSPTQTTARTSFSQAVMAAWYTSLSDHFTFEPTAGAVCLVLLAKRHWSRSRRGSVFNTPLFQPLTQIGHPQLRYIRTRTQLAWRNDLTGRLPEAWVKKLSEESVLAFATPEIGRAVVADRWTLTSDDKEIDISQAATDVLLDLITHHNFYSASKRATLICSGRILELLVTGLVRYVTADDISRILSSAPFHSAVSVAATKAVYFSVDEIEMGEIETEETEDAQIDDGDTAERRQLRKMEIEALASAINAWREKMDVSQLPLSPWLIYCVLNKTFNQAPMFTRPLGLSEQPKRESLSDVAASGLATFNAFWAAMASFEKGPLFGQTVEISNVNLLNRRGNFQHNNLYTQNIRPLLESEHGAEDLGSEKVISATYVLQTHPLRGLLQRLLDRAVELETTIRKPQEHVDGRAYLLQALGLPIDKPRISMATVRNALQNNAPRGASPEKFGNSVLQNVTRRFPTLTQLDVLRRVIVELESNNPAAGQS
ncbi:MAG: hypothetical protein EON54_13285 [Alcaligenaceae bacterium]|nr:MAG: hypothetical protein EON54_13285 [Alcaligenaceae bacterium]